MASKRGVEYEEPSPSLDARASPPPCSSTPSTPLHRSPLPRHHRPAGGHNHAARRRPEASPPPCRSAPPRTSLSRRLPPPRRRLAGRCLLQAATALQLAAVPKPRRLLAAQRCRAGRCRPAGGPADRRRCSGHRRLASGPVARLRLAGWVASRPDLRGRITVVFLDLDLVRLTAAAAWPCESRCPHYAEVHLRRQGEPRCCFPRSI